MATYLPPDHPAAAAAIETAKKTPGKTRKVGNHVENVTTQAAPTAQPTVERVPIEEMLSRAFKTDTAVREVVTANLKERSELTRAAAARTQKAFADFAPTKYEAHVPNRATYLKPGENLLSVQHAAMRRGIEALQNSDSERALRLTKSRELLDMMERAPANDSGIYGTMTLSNLVSYVEKKAQGPLYTRQDAYTLCQAEIDAQKRIDEITGTATATPVLPGETGTTNGAGANGADAGHLTATKVVKDNVETLFASISNPEHYVTFEESPDQKRQRQQAEGAHSPPSFSLRTGASDVTSFHDFHNLQIAFENVWTEIFDQNLEALGRELYEEYDRLKSFTGDTPTRGTAVSSITELKALMDEIRDFTRLTAKNLPPQPPIIAPGANAQQIIDAFNTFNSAILEYYRGINTPVPPAIADTSRLAQLLNSLDKLLSERRYAFDVFAPGAVNFGILVTYRQKWEPREYQVGDLVSTIPLAPKETRRYTTKRVVKKSRAAKEVDDSLQIRRSESIDTSRVDAEIVAKTLNKNSFNITAHESIGGGDTIPYTVESTQTATGDAAKESQQTKKEFRENVMKAAQEYKQEHRLEVDTSESTETEDTTFHEIQNPNDELAVTYMLYELQRTYDISEKLYKLTPVIFIANDVPAPSDITDAWLIQHDWILNHAILDDSFRPALEYLTKSFVGAELNIRILEDNARLQKDVVERITQQVKAADTTLTAAQQDLSAKIQSLSGAQQGAGFFDVVKSIFDPLGITGHQDATGVQAQQTLLDFAKDTLNRAQTERAKLEERLQTAVTSLQSSVNNLSAAVKEHYDRMLEVDRLRVHVKDNILYYMQAIWSHEPPDQRFFRLYNLDIPDIEPDTTNQVVQIYESQAAARAAIAQINQALGQALGNLFVPIPMPTVSFPTRKLVEVADLDNLLGYKGNYMIFPLKQNNYLTLHMMQDYLEVTDELRPRDPDQLGNYTVEDIQALAKCVFQRDRNMFTKHADDFKKAIIDRLTNSRPDTEMIIVPTTSLYIEALVGTHTLLEDFKLIHRALDVKKVQAEVRHAELENIRLASRALKGKDGDPEIDKKIIVETGDKSVVLQPDTN